jgi:thiamine biosynthesis protein ThiS
MTRMDVTINGEARELPAEMTVAALLSQLGLEPNRTVVELNREIVPRERYAQAVVAASDVLELVEIVGGG